MGARAYTLFDNITEAPKGTCIVEIGSQRGEGSTEYFVELSKRLEIPFYTVDIDYEVYIWIAHMTRAFLMSGEEFLARVFPHLDKKIFIAYLDGFDWVWSGMEERDFIVAQRNNYKKLGYELNNKASQESHLEQARLLAPYTVEGSWVLFDDTWPNGVEYDGKGGLAVPHLMSNGFRLDSQTEIADEDNRGYVLLRRV